MHPEEYREAGLNAKFSRQAVLSLLIFAAAWEALSYLAPTLGIPPFAIPSFARIGQSLLTITPIDVFVTLARVIGALILSFVLGVVLATMMYQSHRLESYLHPMIRLFMAVPVVSWILFAVLWFRGVEFRMPHVGRHVRGAGRMAHQVDVVGIAAIGSGVVGGPAHRHGDILLPGRPGRGRR